MKRLFILIYILAFMFLLVGCAYNGTDENLDNSDPNNQMEDLYEEEMSDPDLLESAIIQNFNKEYSGNQTSNLLDNKKSELGSIEMRLARFDDYKINFLGVI